MAAEAVVSVVVEKLLDLVSKQVKEEIDLLTGIEKKVRNLFNTMKRIQAVLADAERRKITDETVKAWLQDLEGVSYEIDDVLDEWNYIILKQEIELGISNVNASTFNGRQQRVCSFTPSSCFCFKQVALRRDITLKIKKLSGRLHLIEKQKNQFSFIASGGVASNLQESKRVQSTSFIDESHVFGRETDKHTLITQLLSTSRRQHNCSTQILSITGTGGIGKTTLAQLAFNDDQVKGVFEKRGWVCVSDPLDEIRVAKAIVESLDLSSPNLNELDSLLQRVKDSVSGKRFLLVLDDVWTDDRDKWELLKNSLKYGAPGSSILLTTRNERVAKVAGATQEIYLDVLSDSESWSLFCQVALFGRAEIECERLEIVGKEISRKCKGLPLAIKTIGSLLRFKNTVEEWQKVVDCNMWELKVAEFELFPHLYLSYSDLPSPIRRCFLYCAVIPKDELIYVDDLIRIWMAQGYLHSSGSEDDMEVRGREYFEHLAIRSFFQDLKIDIYEERIVACKMHDIVHDFAQFLTKGECLTIEGERKEEIVICENARHLIWLGSGEVVGGLLNRNMGKPRSFFAKILKLEILTTPLLNSLKHVRVLSLHNCGLKELSREVGNLIHLRYLDLSCNFSLSKLPITIYELCNLQTLNLLGCQELKELPPGIEKLIKLRHLIHGNVEKFPQGIEKLTCIQTLGYFLVGCAYNKLGYLKNLSQLGGSLQIHIMDNFDNMEAAETPDLKSKKHIQTLTLSSNLSVRAVEDVMDTLEPPPNLQSLRFDSYGGTRLPTWITALNNVRHLSVDCCLSLTSLTTLGMLPSLEKLHILQLPQLKFVRPAILGIRESLPSPPAIGFPKLTELIFWNCVEWEEWEDISSEEEEDDTVSLMPRLRLLSIRKCPKLKALPHRLLHKASSLECIKLEGKEYNPATILSTALTIEDIIAG